MKKASEELMGILLQIEDLVSWGDGLISGFEIDLKVFIERCYFKEGETFNELERCETPGRLLMLVRELSALGFYIHSVEHGKKSFIGWDPEIVVSEYIENIMNQII